MLFLLVVLIAFLQTISSYNTNTTISSKFDKEWTRVSGTTSHDFGLGIAIDSTSSVYITGRVGWFNTVFDGNNNLGYYDMYIMKYTADGTKAWTKLKGTWREDASSAIAVDRNGNIYIAGKTYTGDWSMFFAKYSSDGSTTLWSQTITVASDASGIAFDKDDNVYVTGCIFGSVNGQSYAGDGDIIIIKYSSSGTLLWTRLVGSSGNDAGVGIAVDSTGNIYVTGKVSGSIDGQTHVGGTDIIIMKYSTDGARLWTKIIGSTGNDYGSDITLDNDGNAYLTGTITGSVDGETYAGGTDIIIMKYSSAGTKQWTRLKGSAGDDAGQGIEFDGVGSVYITGTTSGTLDGEPYGGGLDIFLLKYASDGMHLATKVTGTTADEYGCDLAVNDDRIYVTGYFTGTSLDGLSNAGEFDIFVMKFKSYELSKAPTPEPTTLTQPSQTPTLISSSTTTNPKHKPKRRPTPKPTRKRYIYRTHSPSKKPTKSS